MLVRFAPLSAYPHATNKSRRILIFTAAQEGKRLVVIGSSFISMELVAAVSSRKLASIDVIGMEEFPFEAVLGKEVGAALKKFHESKGVRFHMQTKVSKIVASADDPSVAAAVEIPGETLPADFVIMGVGVAPATAYLKESGFELERDGGIKVDEYFRVPGTQDVYAIGIPILRRAAEVEIGGLMNSLR